MENMRPAPDDPKENTVAVVIPFFNGSAFIDRAIRSVLRQSVPPDEFIIVDDGSTSDESEKLIEICVQNGIRVVHQANGGQSAARNAGVRQTSSRYICFLDQDDFYLDDHIEMLKRLIPDDAENFGWAYGDLIVADEHGVEQKRGFVSAAADHPKTSLTRLLSADMFVLPSASIVSRQAFIAVGGFDEQFLGYEDDDLFRRMFQRGFSNIFTPQLVLVWCIHKGSTSYGFLMTRSRLRYLDKLSAEFPDRPEAGEFYVRDFIWPRFKGPTFKFARRSQRPGHPLYQSRDDVFELTRVSLGKLRARHALTARQRRSIRLAWFKIRIARYGLRAFVMSRGRLDPR